MITTTGITGGVLIDAPTSLGTLIEEAQAAAARQTAEYASGERAGLISQIKSLLHKQNAVLVAHYYTKHPEALVLVHPESPVEVIELAD